MREGGQRERVEVGVREGGRTEGESEVGGRTEGES